MPKYFEYFPKVPYLFGNKTEDVQVLTDITTRIGIPDIVKNAYSLVDEYNIKDNETPEMVSYRFYGTVDFYWVLLILNNIIDPKLDWAISDDSLYEMIEDKYSGVSLFFDIENTDSYLNFSKNISSGYYIEDPTSNERVKILSWNPTLSLLEVESFASLDESLLGTTNINVYENSNTPTIYTTLKYLSRVVYDNTESLKHFRDSVSLLNVDPYANLSTYKTDGVVVVSTSSSQTILSSYIKSNENAIIEAGLDIVTNKSFEFEKNEEKRKIKIIKPEFIVQLASGLKQVLENKVGT